MGAYNKEWAKSVYESTGYITLPYYKNYLTPNEQLKLYKNICKLYLDENKTEQEVMTLLNINPTCLKYIKKLYKIHKSKDLFSDRMKKSLKNMSDEQKLKANNEINGVCYITIPDKLYKAIQKGTYKSWLKNDGTAKTGLVYPKKEINEWIKFSNLYSNLFLDINFRNLTYYSMSNPRYDIDNVNKHKYLIKQMRQQIEKHKTEFLDEILKNC